MNEIDEIKVSLIMTVYNGAEFIRNALDSIPVRSDIEIIFVDDGSTDNTLEIMKEYDRIFTKTLKNDENMGIGCSRHKALEYVDGEYVMFFDCDDTINGDNFNKAIEMLDGSDLVYFDLLQNDGVRLHLTPETKGIYPGSVKFMKKNYIDRFDYPQDKRYEDVKFNGMLNSIEHTEKYTNLIVVNYNFPRYDSTSAKWNRGEL